MGVADPVSTGQQSADTYELAAVLQGTELGSLIFVGEHTETGQLVSALGTIQRCASHVMRG